MGWSKRTSRYRYIELRSADFSHEKPVFGSQTLAVELYDYQTDPHERENIAAKAEYSALLKEQQRLFDDLLPYLPRRLG
jgi:hypothetical protein